jgi:hypothetical protein
MKVNIERIIRICNEFGILKKSRNQKLVYQRYAVMHYLRNNTTLPLANIGAIVGGKDHATVLNGLKVYDTMTQMKDSVFYYYIEEIEARLKSIGRIEFIERPKVVVKYRANRKYRSTFISTVQQNSKREPVEYR